MSAPVRCSCLAALLGRVPVLSHAGRCLVGARHGELALLAANLAMAQVLVTLIWGMPALGVVAEIATVSALMLLAALSRG
jgi:hypothetical protein